ncbi:hypothetical protein [Amycolatopsis sp. NBC_01286]|uniref:hypothetical protein n=1 Tax=Amycolatopsis sp. NBC_01286 TaxID=2903560 RepID=UPI002E0E3336|nr:hypothetical protein OG570_10910 [Amycolatopsis sp. NBC_01286]
MGRTLNRVAGIVSAGALITFAAAPAAFAQTDETTTAPSTTETTTSTSETTTTTTVPSTSETTSSSPVTTTGTTSEPSTTDVTKTTTPETTTTTAGPPSDGYQDNTGHGFVGVGGEGVLVINCAAGAPGNVATQYLDVTGGPDQDESDGRTWNYSVRVNGLPPGTTTGKFSWTCAGVDGEGVVDFEQAPPPETSTTTSAPTTTSGTTTSAPSSTAPITTSSGPSTSTTTSTPGNAAPKAQVKVTPHGGVETGFGGTAW